jgi:hypothetical protein
MMRTKIWRVSESAYDRAREEYDGICLSCGARVPDIGTGADPFVCEECDYLAVFSVKEALSMGAIVFVDPDQADSNWTD